ncbi:hypothetical protein KJ966_30940 [bacterium]|nr:hypothetical protein [bacterium]
MSEANAGDFSGIYTMTVILPRFEAVYSLFDTLTLIFASGLNSARDIRFVIITSLLCSVFVMIIPTYLAVAFLIGSIRQLDFCFGLYNFDRLHFLFPVPGRAMTIDASD